MHTFTVYPEHQPSLEEIKAFVHSFPDGEWVTASRAVIESEDGRVYLDYDEHYWEYFDKYLDEQQRAELTARLGFSPRRALHVQASTAYQHSRELAREVCGALMKQWGGGWSEGKDPAFKATEVERQPATMAARDVPPVSVDKETEPLVQPKNKRESHTMNCFRLLATVLDELWDELPGDPDRKQTAIRSHLADLHARYRRLATSPMPVDYRHPATRYAYLAAYVSSHANMVADLIWRADELEQLFKKDSIHITCVGGGPGSDLLGILKHVLSRQLSPRLKFFLFDREPAWSDSWSDVDDKLSTTLPLSTYFEQFDVTDVESWTVKTKYLRADLFTMVYFISEIYQLRDRARAFFVNLFGQAKAGAYYLFIDNAASMFYSWIDEIAEAEGLTVVHKSDDIVLQLPTDEEKTDLGKHLSRIGQSPKLTGNVAFRLFQKT